MRTGKDIGGNRGELRDPHAEAESGHCVAIAALVGKRARARMPTSQMDGRAHAPKELAYSAGVTPPALSIQRSGRWSCRAQGCAPRCRTTDLQQY
jgi:hypothetical protein